MQWLLIRGAVKPTRWKKPCNPAVGGPAKSQLVHELDALGGETGKIVDSFFYTLFFCTASSCRGGEYCFVLITSMSGPSHMFMSVLCCKCGIPMQPNGANMCVECLRPEVDITQGLPKRLELVHCPDCESYLQPPSTWVKLQSNSKDMLIFCLEELQENMNTNRVRLVNAASICTEPHSKRVTLKVRVQKEVVDGVILEQFCDVECVKLEHMCESCSRVVQQANPDHWLAAVQLRQQHVSHRHTFFYLEQLILKHRAAATALRIKQMDQGKNKKIQQRGWNISISPKHSRFYVLEG